MTQKSTIIQIRKGRAVNIFNKNKTTKKETKKNQINTTTTTKYSMVSYIC